MQVFRILIVDDIVDTLEQLRKLLTEVLPNLTLHTASNVEQALQLIDSAVTQGWQYDVVVLDFRLPLSQGMNDEVDQSICLAVPRSVDTLVIHMTAHKEDPSIVRHMVDYHAPRNYAGGEVISKRDLDWDQQLITIIYSHINM